MRVIQLALFIYLFHYSFTAQINNFSLPCYLDNDVLLGEMHYHGKQTALAQYSIYKELISRGEFNSIEFALELPPSTTYFVMKYYETGSEEVLSHTDNLKGNKEIVDLLRADTNDIEIFFKGIDLDCRRNFYNIKLFLIDIFQQNYASTIFADINWKSKRNVIKAFSELNASETLLNKHLNMISNATYKRYFIDQINILDQKHKVLKYGRSKKEVALREKKIINYLNNKSDSTKYTITTLGIYHFYQLASIKNNFNWMTTLIQIIYYEDFGVVWKGELIETEEEFYDLIKNKVIDCFFKAY